MLGGWPTKKYTGITCRFSEAHHTWHWKSKTRLNYKGQFIFNYNHPLWRLESSPSLFQLWNYYRKEQANKFIFKVACTSYICMLFKYAHHWRHSNPRTSDRPLDLILDFIIIFLFHIFIFGRWNKLKFIDINRLQFVIKFSIYICTCISLSL